MTDSPTEWIGDLNAAERLIARSRAMNGGGHARLIDVDTVAIPVESFVKLLIHLQDPNDVELPVKVLAAAWGCEDKFIYAASKGGVSKNGKIITPPLAMTGKRCSLNRLKSWLRQNPEWRTSHARNVPPKCDRTKAISRARRSCRRLKRQ